MKETGSNCIRKTKFKHNCRDVISVFAVLMITGVLLAVSALAQPELSPGALGQGDLFSADSMGGASSNQQPMLTALESDKSSPQEAGSSIKWTAKAEDPENDPMSFIFRLKGPSTGDVWKPVNSDPSDNTWKWNTNPEDAGNYQISVSVRDEMHAGPQFTPDEKISDFTLTAPPVPQEVPAQPAAEPLPDVAAPQQTYQPPTEEQQTAGQEPAVQPQVTEPVNLAPVMISLTADPASPQEAGITVTWEAVASDQESDSLQFLFMLDDQPVSDWQYQNHWTWVTSANEIGVHSIGEGVGESGQRKFDIVFLAEGTKGTHSGNIRSLDKRPGSFIVKELLDRERCLLMFWQVGGVSGPVKGYVILSQDLDIFPM